jgi:hypothetical protein
MTQMRGSLFLVLGASACGSVNSGVPDAAPGPDASGAVAMPGDVVWARSMSAAFGLGIADGVGGLVFSGSITAPTDFGGGLMTPRGRVDLAIGSFKVEDASYVYQVRHNSANDGEVFGFLSQTDSLGNPLIHGVSYRDVDLGRGLVTGGGGAGADGFVGRYGAAAPSWIQRMVGPGEDKIVGTAPAPGGALYAAGWFELTTAWNGTQLESMAQRDFFVARLNAFTGAVAATAHYPNPGREEISSISGNGTDLILGGFFNSTLALGGTARMLTATAGSGLDVFVAKLDATMTPTWAVQFGAGGEDRGTQVALDANGDVYVAGTFAGEVAFGAVNLMAKGPHDIFLAKLRGDTGGVLWAIQLGSDGDDGPDRLVVDRAGHPVLGFNLAQDARLASFEPNNGAQRWEKKVETSGMDFVFGLTVGTTGDLYVVFNIGTPGAAIDLGKPLIGPPAAASVVLRIVP